MLPDLLDLLDACPQTKVWKTRGSWWGSPLSAMAIDQIAEHPNGLVLTLPRSKTNQHGEQAELVVLLRASHLTRCPATTLDTWLTATTISAGSVLRPVSKGNRPLPGSCTPSRSTPRPGRGHPRPPGPQRLQRTTPPPQQPVTPSSSEKVVVGEDHRSRVGMQGGRARRGAGIAPG
jgi:hypothetical protein